MWYVLMIIIIVFSGLIGYRYYDKPDPAGENFTAIETAIEPYQKEMENLSIIPINDKRSELKLEPLAVYKVAGKVLAKKKYGSTWSAKLAPYDLAIGWGELVREDLKEHISYNQWGRFYFYKYEWSSPFKDAYIISHSSNNHIIPASENLKKLLFHLKKDDLIELEGYLVNVTGNVKSKSVTWKTSLIRDDTGSGSCEIFYVNKIKHDNKIYE